MNSEAAVVKEVAISVIFKRAFGKRDPPFVELVH